MNAMQSGDDSMNDFNIIDNNYPMDTVTDIQYPLQGQVAQNQTIFSVTGWDGQLRIYELAEQSPGQFGLLQRTCVNLEEPQLTSAFSPDGNLLAVGGASGTLKIVDFFKGQSMVLGKHEKPISKISWCQNQNMNFITTCSYDGFVKFWSTQNPAPIFSAEFKQRIFTADLREEMGILSIEEEKLAVFSMDLLYQNKPNQIKFTKNPLESQVTAVTLKTGHGGINMGEGRKEIAVGSFDGRANISKAETMPDGNFRLDNVMTFKCHRVDKANHPSKQDVLYPVHSILFNPRSNQFISTAGGDGTMSYWDYVKKNKAKGFNYNRVPVSAARISPKGQFMAYSLGYDWSMGVWGLDSVNYRPRICVHAIQENELVFTG